MSQNYYIISVVITLLVILGISLMNKVKTARLGNTISALAIFIAIVVTIIYFNIFNEINVIYIILIMLGIGLAIGIILAYRVKMIQMPELVALLNGLGGAASGIVGIITFLNPENSVNPLFNQVVSMLAIIIGIVTFLGSMIAAGKLSKIIDGRPITWKSQKFIITLSIIIILLSLVYGSFYYINGLSIIFISIIIFSFIFAYSFTIRVGGADMPITISLLNSLSGVAASLAGIALADIMLVAIGAIVGSSGLVLTEIMSKAMNRPLRDILAGKTSVTPSVIKEVKEEPLPTPIRSDEDPIEWLKTAKTVIIVPGYGMALAQAQYTVKSLMTVLESKGCQVKYAIHPVAGRMPGHMNVLLAEAGVDYDILYEMDDINDEFASTDVTIVIGANDVLNPAARHEVGSPIYGMPILNVDMAPKIIICNYDTKPGYSGVENPLYKRQEGLVLLLGNAKETIEKLVFDLKQAQ